MDSINCCCYCCRNYKLGRQKSKPGQYIGRVEQDRRHGQELELLTACFCEFFSFRPVRSSCFAQCQNYLNGFLMPKNLLSVTSKLLVLQLLLFLGLSGLPFNGLVVSGDSPYLKDMLSFGGLIFPNTFDTIFKSIAI